MRCPRPWRPGAVTGRRAPHESGSGTVLALGLVAVLASLVLVCVALGAAVVARHRAAAAADLAALAGADRSLGRVPGVPCAAADSAARANDAQLTGCRVDGDGSVMVNVQVRLPAPWARLGVAQAAARAGRPPDPWAGPMPVRREPGPQPIVMASSRRLMKSEASTGG